MKPRNLSVIFFAALALASLVARRADAADLFPFQIPGLGAPAKGSVVDVSWLNDGAAGQQGFVSVKDGRFVDGSGKRIRFLATNFTFASCFPDHKAADQLAMRLASLGINCIRFHHMDNQVAPRGIWKPNTPKRNELDPDQMDRLDYFIAALKRHGVYADINLHVSREYWEGEDFPDGLNSRQRRERMPHYGKGVDKINDQMIRMQRQYARMLLTHVNRYTKAAYAQEPCVAFVEINNENSLLQLKMAELPDYYHSDILKKWNAWLKHRYASDAKLQAAWGGSQPLGKDLLSGKWGGQQPGQGYYEVHREPDGSSRVSIHKLPQVTWQLQIHQTGLTLDEGRIYTLAFRGRSDKPRRLSLDVRLQKEDWHNCGLDEPVEFTPQWQEFSYTFRASRVVPAAVRVSMVLGSGPTGDFWIKDMMLRCGGSLGARQGESLTSGNVADGRAAGTPRRVDWVRFLAETERAYTDGMRRFLKEELGVRANIIDTQASYGNIPGCYRESFNDYVDMHAYWQHPHFPGRPWDGNNWLVPNTPMVAAKDTGNFARLPSGNVRRWQAPVRNRAKAQDTLVRNRRRVIMHAQNAACFVRHLLRYRRTRSRTASPAQAAWEARGSHESSPATMRWECSGSSNRRFKRLAIVGDRKWEEWMANFCKSFTKAKVEYFDRFEVYAAWKWLIAHDGVSGAVRSDQAA